MDAAQVGQLSPFILRTCFVFVFAGLLFFHVSVLHPSSTPAKSATEVPRSFSTPRTMYSGKRIIAFDWNLVHGLAHQRISHLEASDFWEPSPFSSVRDGTVAKGCSTLYPSYSPASSCWRDGAGLEQPAQAGKPNKPMQVKVSFLEVPAGETPMSTMTKHMQQALDQATIDAQTEAISKGLSGTQAQEYAEAHRQQLLQSNPQELAAQQLPTFDLDHLDLPSLFPQMLGDADNSGPLAAFSGLIRDLIEQLEATVSALGDDDDEYEEPSLQEAAADTETIDTAYSNIVDTLPVNLHGQPGCPVSPRLAPIPLNISNTPWLPVLKQLFSEFGRADSDASSTAETSMESTTVAGDVSERALDAQTSDDIHSSSSESSSSSAVDTSAAHVSDIWAAGNAVQRKIEMGLKTQRLAPPTHTQDYAKRRLQQVSDLSRRMDDQYNNLFLQRMRAKQLLYERQRREAEAYFHSYEFAEQLNRLLSITQFAMSPVSDEHEAIRHLWRDLVYMASLQTRAVACMTAGGQDVQCYQQAFDSRPHGYAPFEALTEEQQQELRGDMQQLFNASVAQPPVRLPVLHWDERLDGSAHEQRVHLHAGAASEAEAADLWMQGTGEPRQDAWQVMEALAPGHTDKRDELAKALQEQAVQNYLHLQVHQMLSHIQNWSGMMDPEEVKDILLEWRSMHPEDRLPSHDAAAAVTSEELLAQLRAKLMTRSEGRQDDILDDA